jgi:FMN phosphatase YigB (HAD superfamily)
MVVFDLGGVLVRICRSWQEACDAAGQPYHPEMRSPELLEARKAISRRHEIGELECDAFFAAMAASTRGMYTEPQVRAIHGAWLLGEYDGVGTLVDDLHHAGVRTGVLSNTNHAHWVQLMPARWHGGRVPVGVEDLLPAAGYPTLGKIHAPHASHLLGHAKPNPEIHRAFEQAANVSREQLLFFDDLPDNVAGAKAAGWTVEQVDHTGDTAAQMRAALRRRGIL